MDRQTYRHRGIQAYIQKYGQTDKQIDTQIDKHTDRLNFGVIN